MDYGNRDEWRSMRGVWGFFSAGNLLYSLISRQYSALYWNLGLSYVKMTCFICVLYNDPVSLTRRPVLEWIGTRLPHEQQVTSLWYCPVGRSLQKYPRRFGKNAISESRSPSVISSESENTRQPSFETR